MEPESLLPPLQVPPPLYVLSQFNPIHITSPSHLNVNQYTFLFAVYIHPVTNIRYAVCPQVIPNIWGRKRAAN
jgi:hypothetical protein